MAFIELSRRERTPREQRVRRVTGAVEMLSSPLTAIVPVVALSLGSGGLAAGVFLASWLAIGVHGQYRMETGDSRVTESIKIANRLTIPLRRSARRPSAA